VHEYDTVLKSLLTGWENTLFERITGVREGRWINIELPKVAQPRVDLLLETTESDDSARRIIAMELQSTNDPLMPVRMAEYSLSVYRAHEIFPEQYVLYVGSAPMRMPSELAGPNHICRYKIVDIRDLDAETLLNSPLPADNVIAILARYSNKMETIGRILSRIAKLEKSEAERVFSKLAILAGLRRLEDTVKKEARQLPILDDIMDHQIIGPAIRQGNLDMLREQITDRFGTPSPETEERLAKMSVAELKGLGVRLMHVKSLTELFNQ
jgi:hypothetical protein